MLVQLEMSFSRQIAAASENSMGNDVLGDFWLQLQGSNQCLLCAPAIQAAMSEIRVLRVIFLLQPSGFCVVHPVECKPQFVEHPHHLL